MLARWLLISPSVAAGLQPAPDLSGMWGRSSVDFESPPAGPGPVTNTNLRPDGRRNSDRRVGDFNNPILKPFAAQAVKRSGEISLTGETFPNPQNQCRPQPTPYVLWQLEMELLQQKDEVTILYMIDHQVRHIRMNEAHPSHVAPSWTGDSVGHYEGDTLVIDTVGVKVGAFSMLDQYGTPYTEDLHVVERYRLIDGQAAKQAADLGEKQNGGVMGRFVDLRYSGKGLQVQLTVEDSGAFNGPWSAMVTYRRGLEWLEYICAESPFDYATGRNPRLPIADRPDF